MNSTKGYLQSGFTLTEMVVAITIFVLIITAVYSAYTLSLQGYREGERAAEITQNGRIILERLTREMRQAREIVTELPEGEVNPPGEIVFHDGHLSSIVEEDTAQGGGTNTVTLSSAASTINDYYKGMFIKITEGTGAEQIRKINNYDGTTKVANIEGEWETIPDASSKYYIDSSYYYIRYFRDDFNNVGRQIFVYYFSGDPDSYVSWDDEDEEGGSPGGPDSCILESCPGCPITCFILEERVIGEYVTMMNFWGLEVVNIFLNLEKDNKTTEFETTVFGRNI